MAGCHQSPTKIGRTNKEPRLQTKYKLAPNPPLCPKHTEHNTPPKNTPAPHQLHRRRLSTRSVMALFSSPRRMLPRGDEASRFWKARRFNDTFGVLTNIANGTHELVARPKVRANQKGTILETPRPTSTSRWRRCW